MMFQQYFIEAGDTKQKQVKVVGMVDSVDVGVKVEGVAGPLCREGVG